MESVLLVALALVLVLSIAAVRLRSRLAARETELALLKHECGDAAARQREWQSARR